MKLGKLLNKVVKNRKILIAAATLVAPGAVSKVARKVKKIKDRHRDRGE